MKRHLIFIVAVAFASFISGCSHSLNPMNNPSFSDDGMCNDTIDIFTEQLPRSVTLYIETSGSMNGFFRANYATKFKTTVWSVFSGLEGLTNGNVYPLTNSGQQDNPCSLSQFRTAMNQGEFVSNAETQVPDMLSTIISSLNIKEDEAAVLVSDMKYSPTGQKSMQALLDQYRTEIRNLVGKSGVSISYVCAVSQYLDKQGNIAADRSPYYFIIIGNGENIAYLRNRISTWVENEGCYVESGDIGVDYRTPLFSYLNPRNMIRLDYSEPVLVNTDRGLIINKDNCESTYTDVDRDYSDTCSFTLRIDLNSFPWKAANKELLDSCLIIGGECGSKVSKEVLDVVDDHHFNREFERLSYVDYQIKVFDMPGDSEVLNWYFSIEPFDNTVSSDFHYIITGESESELDRSFSFDKFIYGSSNGRINRYSTIPKKILITTITQ